MLRPTNFEPAWFDELKGASAIFQFCWHDHIFVGLLSFFEVVFDGLSSRLWYLLSRVQ